MRESKINVRGMVATALFAALICVAAPFSVQVGPVPITLATFAVYLVGALLGARRGMAAVGVYIMIGAVGLPVFSGFKGGFAVLSGPTGGYIVGYVLVALITGIFAEMNSKANRTVMTVIGMILATAALYAFGTAWYMFLTKSDILSALSLCAVPFLPGDAVKIACVTAVSVPLKAKLNRAIRGSDTRQS